MKVQAVVVLYKQAVAESVTMQSLSEQIPNSGLCMSLLVYDNSPEPARCQNPILDTLSAAYIHDPTNGGLVPAYNAGLRMAQKNGAEWLLLLDQDTKLTNSYFVSLAKAYRQYGEDLNIAAFAPHIAVRGKYLAPSWFSMGMHRRIKPAWNGVAHSPITSINSATTVRVSFLQELHGFDGEYPLDYTDYWLYREIYRRKKSVVVLDCSLAHELSSANRDTFRPVAQYRDVLHHEGKFYRSSGSRIVVCIFWLRLILRVVKHYFVFKDKGYSHAAIAYIRGELLSGTKEGAQSRKRL